MYQVPLHICIDPNANVSLVIKGDTHGLCVLGPRAFQLFQFGGILLVSLVEELHEQHEVRKENGHAEGRTLVVTGTKKFALNA